MIDLALWAVLSTTNQSGKGYSEYAVVSDSQIASEVGAAILEKGGNAVDAAVAVGLALAVTHPAAGNIGGGGFMVIRMENGNARALDFRETAPGTATADMYRERPKDSLVGYRAAGVPGTVAGLAEAHRKYGSLPWKAVVDPSVQLAKDGFEVPEGLAKSLKAQASSFKGFPASYAQFNRNGNFYKPGERFRQPALASTLALIRDNGKSGFYQGRVAQQIAACGTISLEDLKGYVPVWREPLRAVSGDYEILTMPPPSSGGVAFVQMLQILRKDRLAASGWNTAPTLHLLVEAMKRAFADRSEHMADPDFETVPVESLLDLGYADQLRASIGASATPSAKVAAWKPNFQEHEQTTHYSIVDKDGNAVSTTYTLNGSYGSYAVVPGAGFLLNNEMDDFTTQPGKPNLFGLIQGEKNRVAPGKRPLSSMTPSIAAKDGKVVLVWGSPGGPTIINTVLQTFLNVAVFGKDVQTAVTAPRFHHQWMPDEIRWEPDGLSASTKSQMERMGHVFELKARGFGACHAIWIGDQLYVGIDPRTSTSGAAGK